jgi:hypothetical protein
MDLFYFWQCVQPGKRFLPACPLGQTFVTGQACDWEGRCDFGELKCDCVVNDAGNGSAFCTPVDAGADEPQMSTIEAAIDVTRETGGTLDATSDAGEISSADP